MPEESLFAPSGSPQASRPKGALLAAHSDTPAASRPEGAQVRHHSAACFFGLEGAVLGLRAMTGFRYCPV